MPYIKQYERDALDEALEKIAGCITHVGQLNYAITKLARAFTEGYSGVKPGYVDYNAAIGVLECAKLELYRRRLAIYEDSKILENGDVY